MIESTWIQSNWYELGNLLSQFAFLAAGIWFARKILRTMRASQEQFGALLKLSMTSSVTERPSSYAGGANSPYTVGTRGNGSDSLGNGSPQRARVAAGSYEQCRSHPLAQSYQVAPGTRSRLTRLLLM
jgi:hypothetical protein